MRKFILAASLALCIVGLSACGNGDDQDKAAAPTTAAAPVAKPSSPTDTAAWGKYLGSIVKANMQGMTADRPYNYLVPAGDDDAALAGRERQLENVQGTTVRGVLPGNMLAFGGPDSAKTADLVVAAFKDTQAGSFKKVIVLFIGDAADKDRVGAVITPTGAEYRFVQM